MYQTPRFLTMLAALSSVWFIANGYDWMAVVVGGVACAMFAVTPNKKSD